ncbi:MAG: Septum formation protein Maf [Microgenomates bacterium OLB23]|nr:MAG: Septum formation protein Maf [Microgenomates bacterium OLB23]
MHTSYPFILASTSPRRCDLLKNIGLKFKVVPSEYEEDMTLPLSPAELTIHLSLEKARAVAQNNPNAVIIGADTIVFCNNQLLGKAHTPEEAKRMLHLLSGKTHQVITGMTIIIPSVKTPQSSASINEVTFKDLSDAQIDWYINSGEPLGKAGAYAIQGLGGMLVSSIKGSYSGIVGLPIEELYDIFTQHKLW